MRRAIAIILLWTASAWAHMGACRPSEVGLKVTVCDLGNRTRCIPTQNVAKQGKLGWIIGRCQGEPAPCIGDQCGPDYSVCCQYSNGNVVTAGSVADCPPKDPAGACLATVAEAARADPLSHRCVPDDTEAPGGNLARAAAEPLDGSTVIRYRIVGSTYIPSNCEEPNTVACCIYATGTTTVDNTCLNCPAMLGGAKFADCKVDAYSSGDGRSCISIPQ